MKPSEGGTQQRSSEPLSGPCSVPAVEIIERGRGERRVRLLTSVISTGEENRQGGFDLDDKRIKYGIFPFWGLVDDNAAESTQLTQADVERLDTLCWRALKNQTTSRSKLGKSLASTSAQSTNLRTTTSAVSTNSSTSVRTAPTLFAP